MNNPILALALALCVSLSPALFGGPGAAASAAAPVAAAATPRPASDAAPTGARTPERLAATSTAMSTAPTTAKPAEKSNGKAVPLIDINTASEEELATLPGIGEARSKAIVKGRPYARKDELVRRKIIPQGVYDGIRERIIAKQKP